MNLHEIILYCLFGTILLLCGFLLFKIFNISTKLKMISTFLDGEVFSERFHNVIDSYFSNSETIDRLMDHVLPLVYAHTGVVYSETPVVTTQTKTRSIINPSLIVTSQEPTGPTGPTGPKDITEGCTGNTGK